MDNKDIIKNINTTQRLVQIDEYYKHVFKKTEKIVSVVFYIANKIDDKNKNDVFDDVLVSAREAHDTVLKSLEVRLHVAEEELRAIAHKLIGLESKLRIAGSAGTIAPEAVTVFTNEIEIVLRYINKYLKSTSAFDDVNYGIGTWFGNEQVNTIAQTSAHKVSSPTQVSSPGKSHESRRDRITGILKTMGEASIKDISDIIKDCSEKTLQRELGSMIDENIVNRIGEKRWSRYTLA